ncbi:MAG: efflux RND transporter periplasmic adaptor subunit, partial [Terracidiphilus sp.]
MNRGKNCAVGLAAPHFVLLSALAISLVWLAGCRKPQPTLQTEVTVEAGHPVKGPIVAHFKADAVLAPVAEAAIEPKITAPVRRFYVERGSRVRAGELLATLEDSDLTAAALESRGLYLAAQAQYAAATQAQVPEETARAELDAAAARANLELNRSIVKSRERLFAEGAIPGRDLDTARAALVQARTA